ncbi:hypothetical protein BH10ACT1_BH10ACT1_16060 [soil metagenome]
MRPSVHHQRRVLLGIVGGALVLWGLAVGSAAAGAAAAQVPPTTAPATTSTVAASTSTSNEGSEECTDRVHDATGASSDPVAPEVVAAADRLVASGLDVRVRIQLDVPDAGEVARLERSCGWSADGVRPANAVELFVAPSRNAAALWYGSDLRSTIGARFSTLQAQVTTGGTEDQVALLDGIGALAAAGPKPDLLGCDQLVWDPLEQLGDDTSVEDAAFAYQAQGVDLRVRVEGATDGDIDARQADLEAACPGWRVDGDRPPARVLLMLQPQARSTGLWYGTDQAAELDDGVFEDIQVDVMNPRFKDGDFAGGLAAGLERLAGPRYSSGFDPYDPYPYRPDDSSDGGSGTSSTSRGPSGGELLGPFFLIAVVAVAAWGFSYLNWRSKSESGEISESFGEYSRSRGGSSYRRFGSSGGGGRSSGGRRSSGGGGRRSSGGGGRRSGGGSTRW